MKDFGLRVAVLLALLLPGFSRAQTGAPPPYAVQQPVANGQCLVWSSAKNAYINSSCGGGSSAFSGLTSGTNTAAAMVVSTGASLGASGTGTIGATSVPASGVSAGNLSSGVNSSAGNPLADLSSVQTFTGKTISNNIIYADDVNPANSGATNDTNFSTHIAACVAIGGCTIQVGNYTSPIPLNNSSACAVPLGVSVATGIATADTPYNGVNVNGQGWTINQNTQRAVSGTVFQGTSTSFPLFCYNSVDNTVDYSSTANFTASYLTGVSFTNFAMDTCSTCMQIGALSKAGLNFSRINNLYASNFVNWGFWLENFALNDFQNINVAANNSGGTGAGPISETGNQGMMAFVASAGSLYNPGNATFRRLFSQAFGTGVTSTPRGIVFMQRTSAGGATGAFNDLNVYDVQSNMTGPQAAISCTATSAASGNNLTLSACSSGASATTNFPVDMPVFVSDAGSAIGLGRYQTYFVKSNASGVITLGSSEGTSTAITPTASQSDTLYTMGWPPIEVVAYGNSGGNTVQPMRINGVDAEPQGTTMVYFQNATATVQLGTVGSQQGTGSSQAASDITARNSSVIISANDPTVVDFDPGSNSQSMLANVPLATDTAAKAVILGTTPFGFVIDRHQSSAGLMLGGIPSNMFGAQLISSNGLGGQAFLVPQEAIGQRAIVASSGSNSLIGYYAGAVVFNATASGTQTLANINTVTSTTTSTNGAPSGSQAGAPFLLFNEGTGVQTVIPHAGQLFNAVGAAVTATNASPAVFTGLTLPNGMPVVLSGTAVPTGFTATTVYYVVGTSGNTFELAATLGGSAINSSSTGTSVVAHYGQVSITLPRNTFVSLRAAVDGSIGYWVVESMLGAYYSAPTISSGFGSTPTIPSVFGNGYELSFSVNVGTGGIASSGVIALPVSSNGNGWACAPSDGGATPTGQTEVSSSGVTSVTLTNYSRTVGTAVAWTASEILEVSCAPN